MAKLTELLKKLDYQVISGNDEIEINHIIRDSKKVEEGDLFVCIEGAIQDGHKYIKDVIEKGAKAIVIENSDSHIEITDGDVTIIKVADTKLALAYMSAAYFGHPAEKLKTIGITGTKGKTTTAYMVYKVLNDAGIKTGLIGTIETIIGDEHIPAVNTTPESYLVQEIFAKMVEEGIEAVVMEVSSQGLMLHRVAGFVFDYGVFTNLGKDHIGGSEHKDFQDYMRCKALLFKQCNHGIINIDDEHSDNMIEGAACTIETFGVTEDAQIRAENIELYKEPGVLGISYDLVINDSNEKYPIKIDIPGKFNVYNSLTAIAICRHFVSDMNRIHNVLAKIRVNGRAEILPVTDKFTVILDYAHNAMSLESLLISLKEYSPKRIVTLFGCGGNRDVNRRFEMGEVSARLADFTIITSDNPRNEKPELIIKDIIVGVEKAKGEYVAIIERDKAVKYAMDHGQNGDVIVIAGKGHEDYQIIGDTKYHMDDRELVENAVKELKK